MGFVKQAVQIFADRVDELEEFKITLENRIDYHRELIKQEISLFNYINQSLMAVETEKTFSEFPSDLAVDIFSELGVTKNILDIQEGFEEEANEPYYYYKFDEIWDYVKKLQPLDYLVSMIVIASSNSSWRSVTKIQRLIVREIATHEFKVNYRKSSVFIAMSFGQEMEKARKTIIDVVEEYGYQAMLIDIKEHNNQIVPEIFFEIEKSSFVIADLTEHKTGVYLEAGYALAKDKQVIMTCKADDFNERHFDVNQINTIRWEDETDLEKRLRSRIKTMHLDSI